MSAGPRKILVLGSGGREHALAWRLAGGEAPFEEREVVVSPGNAGIAREFRCELPRGEGVDGVVSLAREEGADLVVVGPEQLLVDGVVDALGDAGIAAFGPSRAAARLEGSKSFMKSVCQRAGVPTASFLSTSRLDEARRFIEERARNRKGVVVKADGLCAGKGVVVCANPADALEAAADFLGAAPGASPRFGEASRTIVLEDLLPGEELSVFALCDGHDALVFGAARDHKRLLDGDRGPNTGGMGAVAPLNDQEANAGGALSRVRERVFLPVLDEMRNRGVPFRGMLFAGLMVHDGEPRVLEFNVRFGDPETQALLMAYRGDLAPLLSTCARHERFAKGTTLATSEADKAAVVVVASEGYPDAPRKGAVVEGLAEAEAVSGVKVFCAGVSAQGGKLVVSGGRVLGVAARGGTFDEALDRAYAAADRLCIEGALMRRDIGHSVRSRRPPRL